MFIAALFIIEKDWKCLSLKNWPNMVNANTNEDIKKND